MADPNLVDFYDRVSRFEQARAHGWAHQTGGYPEPRRMRAATRRRRSFLLPLLLVAFAVFAMKGAILYSVGASAYQDRVARLEAGESFDRLGAWMMQADPVTEFMAGQIAHAMLQIRK